MSKICVVYTQTSKGLSALKMAMDLALHFDDRLLSVTPVTIFAASKKEAAATLQPAVDADELVKNNVTAAVANHTNTREFTVSLFDEGRGPTIDDDAILVSDELVPDGRPHHCLYPGTESGIATRHNGPVVIPFSNKDTGLRAAMVVFEWIKRSRTSVVKRDGISGGTSPDVVFYHTTWKDPNVRSSDPVDHMCENAQRVRIALEEAAEEHGIRFRTIVETHDDIVKGIIETSFKEHAVMVAMARGSDVTQGSNVDRLVMQCAIPVLVVSENTQPVAGSANDARLASDRAAREAARSGNKKVVKGWLSGLLHTPLLYNPHFVMSISATMYALKVATKCLSGWWFNLATMLADGFHNVADLLQSFVVMVVIHISQRPATERYPYGRKNLEWISSGIIGAGLCLTGVLFFAVCVSGLLYFWFPPAYTLAHAWSPWLPSIEISVLNAKTFPWVFAIMAGSAFLSEGIGRYQVFVGNRTGHASMIADGEETRSDALVELVVLAGIILDFSLGWHAIHYPIGLLVAWKICNTGTELFQTGYRVICQHSIDDEHLGALRLAAMNVAGVNEVKTLKAFLVGHTVVVHATIVTPALGAASGYVQRAVENAFDAYLTDPATEFQGCDLHIMLKEPDPNFTRIGFALSAVQGKMYVAASLNGATHLAVCDVQRNSVVKTHVVPFGHDPVGLVLEKQFASVHVFNPDEGAIADAHQALHARIAQMVAPDAIPHPVLAAATTYALSPLGVIA